MIPARPGWGLLGSEGLVFALTEKTCKLPPAGKSPDYMVPKRFFFMSRLPRVLNNKFDRSALLKTLEKTQ
jgi:hypothetical protein